MPTYSDISNRFVSQLEPLYDKVEIRALFHLYAQKKWGIEPYRLYLILNDSLDEVQAEVAVRDLERMSKGEPIQYVIGKADFYGLELAVNSSVLIPRPETEELVDLIIKENAERDTLRILDLGTGSGAIAIALAKHLPYAAITAIDISDKALATASQNACSQNVKIDFHKMDIFHLQDEILPNFDIIVSNPPYIPHQEKDSLHCNVRNYEPDLALFVPDDNPLLFYQSIAKIGTMMLNPHGKVYCETHHLFHQQLQCLFEDCGYQDFISVMDINGRDRFIKASWF